MDLQHSKKVLDKINALYQSLSVEEEHISTIERDLMLSYIRQLYESFLKTTPETLSAPARKAIKKVKIEKETKPDPQEATPKKEAPHEPVFEIATPEPTPPAPPKAVVPEKPQQQAPPVPAAPPVKTTALGKYKSIFDNKEANELSEKLSLQPISDITRAISINDKLLYVNDLFGKDADTYALTINKLNNFSSLEEANNLLLEYAKTNNWLDEEKKDTARSFIKLVKRRFI